MRDTTVPRRRARAAALTAAVALLVAMPVAAQPPAHATPSGLDGRPVEPPPLAPLTVPDTTVPTMPVVGDRGAAPLSAADAATAARVRAAARRATALRIVVSLEARELVVLRGADTLRRAPVAIGRDTSITFESTTWAFATPRGIRRIGAKSEHPVWIPPDWHYVEAAHREGLAVGRLRRDRPVALASGDTLAVRGDVAGLIRHGGVFDTLAEDEELIFGDTLYIPPYGTRNRRIAGQLGRYRFDMGDGYLLHGTPEVESIGRAATHGCLRLRDEDLAWLYAMVPVGTRVYIH